MSSGAKDYQLVKYKHGGNTYEVACKPGSVLKFRKGQLGIDNVLLTDEVFSNFHKGDKLKQSDLEAVFGTKDAQTAARIVLEKGEVQLTAAERKELVDRKRAEIVNYIHKYYVDPKTKTPHPVARIEGAIDELKFHVDLDHPVDRQIADLLKRLPDVLTIRKQEVSGTLRVPHKHMGSVGGSLSRFAEVKSEKWDADGCIMEISLVPGDYDPLLAELNRLTSGEFSFEVEGATSAAAAAASSDEPRGKGRAKPKGGRK